MKASSRCILAYLDFGEKILWIGMVIPDVEKMGRRIFPTSHLAAARSAVKNPDSW